MDNKMLASYVAFAFIVFFILIILEVRKRRQGDIKEVVREKAKKGKKGEIIKEPDEPKCELCAGPVASQIYSIPKISEREWFFNLGGLKIITSRKIVPSNIFGCGQCREYARSECERMLQSVFTDRAKLKEREVDTIITFKEKLLINLKDRLKIERDKKKELSNGKS